MNDVYGEIQAAYDELSSPEPDAPPASTSDESTPDESTVETPAPATAEPTQEPAAEAAPASGPTETEDGIPLVGNLPVARHKAILDKTRARYDEQLNRLRWAERLNPDDVTLKVKVAEMIEADPLAAYERLGAVLRSDPRFADRLQPPAPPAAPPPEAKMPEPDVLLDNGTLVYSDKQARALAEWQQAQTLKRVEETFGPIRQRFEGERAWNEALKRTAGQLHEARTSWPMFNEHESDMKAYIAAEMQAGRRVSLDVAYRRVVVPKLQEREQRARAEERQKVLAELKAKASVSATERPTPAPKAAAGSDATKRFMTAGDVARDVFRELSGR